MWMHPHTIKIMETNTNTPEAKHPPSAGCIPRLVVPLNWDHPTYYPVRCPACGWEGMSDQTGGGEQIADTGDYNDCVCPDCLALGGDPEVGQWVPVEDIPNPLHNREL